MYQPLFLKPAGPELQGSLGTFPPERPHSTSSPPRMGSRPVTEAIADLHPLPPHSGPRAAQDRKPESGKGAAAHGAVVSEPPLPSPAPHFPSPPRAFVPWSSHPPTLQGNWSVSWKTPGAELGASVPCIRVQGRREPGGQTGLGTHQWGRSWLASKSPPPLHPHCYPWRPRRDGGGRRAGLEDRTSSWQDTGRQAGGSQPQSRPQGEKVTGAWVSPVPRWASALMASPSCFISEDSVPSTNETPWSLIPPPPAQGPLGQAGCGPAPTPTPGGSRPRAPSQGAPQSTGERSRPGGTVTCTVGSPPPWRNRLLQMNLGPTALEARFHADPSQDKKLIDS